jgi:L-alanine-DL-glutamate epimerase-like enolase superfamily enzyme
VKHSLTRLSIPFREPFATATGVVSARELLLLRVEDEDGAVGFGEAAPFEPYDGVAIDDVAAALEAGPGGYDPPQARAAKEMAALDLVARREGRALGKPGAEAIAVNRTLSAGPPEEVAARAADGLRAGFACFKLKVGLPDDTERVAAVRAAIGPWPALRVDANGAWDVEQAVGAIESLSAYDLELVEQPCRTLEELAEVRAAVEVPIAADESVATADDVRTAAELGACDVVNVKLAASGGFGAAREALREARRRKLEPFLSSTFDGPWGIAAALQLAAGERLSLACGLATLELFDAAIARALPPPERGLMPVPLGPGLGVTVDDRALAEVLVEELAQ